MEQSDTGPAACEECDGDPHAEGADDSLGHDEKRAAATVEEADEAEQE